MPKAGLGWNPKSDTMISIQKQPAQYYKDLIYVSISKAGGEKHHLSGNLLHLGNTTVPPPPNFFPCLPVSVGSWQLPGQVPTVLLARFLEMVCPASYQVLFLALLMAERRFLSSCSIKSQVCNDFCLKFLQRCGNWKPSAKNQGAFALFLLWGAFSNSEL